MLPFALTLLFLGLSNVLLAAKSGSVKISTPAPKKSDKRKAEALEPPPPFEVMRNDILGLRNRPFPHTDWIGNVAEEIWVHIFKYSIRTLDGFFVCLRTCKTFFAVLHNNCNDFIDHQITNERALFKFIWNSELRLNRKMIGILRGELQARSAQLRADYWEDSSHGAFQEFHMSILGRSDDFQILSEFFGVTVKGQLHLAGVLRKFGLKVTNIYYMERVGCYFVPPKEHQKLFEEVSPKLIVVTTSRNMEKSTQRTFVPSLLADYVIPSYLDKTILNDTELEIIRAVVKHSHILFREYFEFLRWACYFLTGEIRKKEKSTILPIAEHLEHLGFDWNKLYVNFPAKNDLPPLISKVDMEAVFKVAHQWGLDIKKMAKNTTSWCTISAAIMRNELPGYLKKPQPNSVIAIIQILHQGRIELELHDFMTNEQNANLQVPTDNDIVMSVPKSIVVIGSTWQEQEFKRQRRESVQEEVLKSDPIDFEQMRLQVQCNANLIQPQQPNPVPFQASAQPQVNSMSQKVIAGPQQFNFQNRQPNPISQHVSTQTQQLNTQLFQLNSISQHVSTQPQQFNAQSLQFNPQPQQLNIPTQQFYHAPQHFNLLAQPLSAQAMYLNFQSQPLNLLAQQLHPHGQNIKALNVHPQEPHTVKSSAHQEFLQPNFMALPGSQPTLTHNPFEKNK